MLIEQIVEFQLRRPGLHGLTCTSISGYFYDKTKISKENLGVGFHLLLNVARDNAPYFPLSGPNHVQLHLHTKMPNVKRVLDLNCN